MGESNPKGDEPDLPEGAEAANPGEGKVKKKDRVYHEPGDLNTDPVGAPAPCVKPGESTGQTWNRLRREGRSAGMSRRGSRAYADRWVERVNPEVPPEPKPEPKPEPEPVAADSAEGAGGLSGLGDIPASWPELPPNAGLAAEVQWVQANRLLVREGDSVNLSLSRSPAPSHAALSWLETAILFPSKFADVAVKVTQHSEDEREVIRRERLLIEEVRGILTEMLAGITEPKEPT